jgi:colanic acid/amylovoran biosynthesis glycosyltransferase
LVITHPDGTVSLDEKLRAGMARYQEHWPDEVILAARSQRGQTTTGVGKTTVSEKSLGFTLHGADNWSEAVRGARPDLVLAPLIPRVAELSDFVRRMVLVAEFSPEELTSSEQTASSGWLASARIRAGGRRRSHFFDGLVRATRGVQCNGYPAYERFRSASSMPLLFFDSRLTTEHVALAQALNRRPPSSSVRLCFSGRLIPGKGPNYAIDAAIALARAGLDVTMSVLGGGELEPQLRRIAPSFVRFGGGLRFQDEWTRFVREEVDLMVLPHVQGDPSGTYLESAGCGVPVLGFDNVALSSLVDRHGIGWTATVRDVAGLVERAHNVLADGAEWGRARAAGLRFMSEHPFEVEFTRRVEHLLALAPD